MSQDLFDAQAFARSLYHNSKRQGQDTATPLVLLGVITCCIGATMVVRGMTGKPFSLTEGRGMNGPLTPRALR